MRVKMRSVAFVNRRLRDWHPESSTPVMIVPSHGVDAAIAFISHASRHGLTAVGIHVQSVGGTGSSMLMKSSSNQKPETHPENPRSLISGHQRSAATE